MQIMAVQVGNAIVALDPGQPLTVSVGDTLRVFYAFNYKVAETTGVEIWASLYKYVVGILNRQEQAQKKQTITLEKAIEWRPYEGEIDIGVGDVSPGTYGLICELPKYDVEHHIDDCIEVTAPPSVWEMMGPLLVLGLMAGMVSMMAPMMEEGFS